MLLVQADDVEAFDALYDRYISKAMLVTSAMQVSRDRVEDVVQEAFLAVWRARSSYRPGRGRVHAWILAIVRNRAIDSIRQHGRHDRARTAGDCSIEGLPALEDVEADAVQRDDAQELRTMLWALPLAQREVIALAYFGKLTHEEIARGLDMPLGTVKGRMRLGLKKLRGQIAA